jgi:hypothetical protein
VKVCDRLECFKLQNIFLCSFKRTSLAHSVNDLKKINWVIQQFFTFQSDLLHFLQNTGGLNSVSRELKKFPTILDFPFSYRKFLEFEVEEEKKVLSQFIFLLYQSRVGRRNIQESETDAGLKFKIKIC